MTRRGWSWSCTRCWSRGSSRRWGRSRRSRRCARPPGPSGSSKKSSCERIPALMRAIQITELSGPATALKLADVPEPPHEHPMTPGSGIVVDVKSAGVSFPELLQTRGEYQMKPDLPFVPGSEVGGIVREVHGHDTTVKPGDRVAAFCMLGAWAQRAVAPGHFTFRIPDDWDYAQGAALVLNYHTAYFA